MKNKYEDWCYICGELVEEEKGIAEQRTRNPGDPGWGATRWVVRHTSCIPENAGPIRRTATNDEQSLNP